MTRLLDNGRVERTLESLLAGRHFAPGRMAFVVGPGRWARPRSPLDSVRLWVGYLERLSFVHRVRPNAARLPRARPRMRLNA